MEATKPFLSSPTEILLHQSAWYKQVSSKILHSSTAEVLQRPDTSEEGTKSWISVLKMQLHQHDEASNDSFRDLPPL